jgi:hypothetical protein
MYLDVFPEPGELITDCRSQSNSADKTDRRTSAKPIVPFLSVSNMFISNFTVSRSNAVLFHPQNKKERDQLSMCFDICSYQSNLHLLARSLESVVGLIDLELKTEPAHSAPGRLWLQNGL